MSSEARDPVAILAEVLGPDASVAAPAAGTNPPGPGPSGAPPTPPAPTDAAKTGEAGSGEKLPDFLVAALNRVHERDRAIAERERALAEKERGATPEVKKTWSVAAQKANIRGYLKEVLGLAPGDVARALMIDNIADPSKIPAEYRALDERLRAGGQTEQTIEELREELAKLKGQYSEESQAQKIERARAEYAYHLDRYVGGELESTFPNAARALKADRDAAMEEVWDIISKDARAKIERGGHEEPMTQQEAIKAFDTRLSKLQRFYGTSAPAAATSPSPKTLANTQSVAPPPKGPGPDDTDARMAAALLDLDNL